MTPRTPLTYYGGKQRLAHTIAALLPPHRIYCEPFAGGAAVLYAKPRAERETLNDLDGRVVTFWRVLRERPDELARAVALTPYSRAEWEACFAEPEVSDELEAARRFVVLLQQSYVRAARGWSPPSIAVDRVHRWQARVWEELPERLALAAARLAGVALDCRDALELIPTFDTPHALLYVDPPYCPSVRTAKSDGYHVDVDVDFWPQLVDVLAQVQHAAVVLSGYPVPAVERLGWRRVDLVAHKSASARAGTEISRTPEALWLSPRALGAQLVLGNDAADAAIDSGALVELPA